MWNFPNNVCKPEISFIYEREIRNANFVILKLGLRLIGLELSETERKKL